VAAAFKGNKEFMRSKPLMWEWRYRVFNHRWNCSPILSIRDGRWKLLFNPDDSRIELYDMEIDPFEESNQALQHSDVVERLKKRALKWHSALSESPLDKEAGTQPARWPKEFDPNVKYLDRNVIFNKSDKDKDGRMSREEYLLNFGPPGAEKRKEGEERFPGFDGNKDGWLNREEFYYMGK
jgi:hypothetical protein